MSDYYDTCIIELTGSQIAEMLSDMYVKHEYYLENVTTHSWYWFLDKFETYLAEDYNAINALNRLDYDICVEIIESDPENAYCDTKLNEILDKYSDMLIEYCISVDAIADFLDELCDLIQMRDALVVLETKLRKIAVFADISNSKTGFVKSTSLEF
jgi:hypothetical protein